MQPIAAHTSLDDRLWRYVGGVNVELLGVPRDLAPGYAEGGPHVGPIAERLSCSVRFTRAKPLSLDDLRARWTWDDDVCDVRYLGIMARLRHVADGAYAASLEVPGDARELSWLLSALVVAIRARRGAVVLHAAGVELDGHAVLFVGPSGAGKTTACNLLRSARGFVRDRVLVVPEEDGWSAWALPGWSPTDQRLPASSHSHLPVAAVLAVEHGSIPKVRRASGLEAMTRLRESTMTADDSVEAERDVLETMERLTRQARFGVLTTVLGTSCDSAVRTWIEQGRD